MAVHVFVDESRRRKGPYFLVASVVDSSDLSLCRKLMREIVGRGQKKIHFNNESDDRRKVILDQIAQANIKSIIYFSECADDIGARYGCFSQLLREVPGIRCNRIVVESRESQDHRDEKWFLSARSRLGYHVNLAHLPPHSDPLLWVPDAIGWSYGRKGQWRNKVTNLKLVEAVKSVDG